MGLRYWCFGGTVNRQTGYKEARTIDEVESLLKEKRIVFVTFGDLSEMNDNLLRDGPYCTIEKERMYILQSHDTFLGVFNTLNPVLIDAYKYLIKHRERE